MPSRCAVLMTRQAISPRLAIGILENMGLTLPGRKTWGPKELVARRFDPLGVFSEVKHAGDQRDVVVDVPSRIIALVVGELLCRKRAGIIDELPWLAGAIACDTHSVCFVLTTVQRPHEQQPRRTAGIVICCGFLPLFVQPLGESDPASVLLHALCVPGFGCTNHVKPALVVADLAEFRGGDRRRCKLND